MVGRGSLHEDIVRIEDVMYVKTSCVLKMSCTNNLCLVRMRKSTDETQQPSACLSSNTPVSVVAADQRCLHVPYPLSIQRIRTKPVKQHIVKQNTRNFWQTPAADCVSISQRRHVRSVGVATRCHLRLTHLAHCDLVRVAHAQSARSTRLAYRVLFTILSRHRNSPPSSPM